MRRLRWFLAAALAAAAFALWAVHTVEDVSKDDHDWRLASGRGLR